MESIISYWEELYHIPTASHEKRIDLSVQILMMYSYAEEEERKDEDTIDAVVGASATLAIISTVKKEVKEKISNIVASCKNKLPPLTRQLFITALK